MGQRRYLGRAGERVQMSVLPRWWSPASQRLDDWFDHSFEECGTLSQTNASGYSGTEEKTGEDTPARRDDWGEVAD